MTIETDILPLCGRYFPEKSELKMSSSHHHKKSESETVETIESIYLSYEYTYKNRKFYFNSHFPGRMR